MALPKPLSQKRIQQMFSTWNPQTVDLLHDYFAALSNLYGLIQLDDAWKTVRTYKPKFRKKDFIDFSTIAQREALPYYILDANEIFTDELPLPEHRFIVNKQIVNNGYYKYMRLYLINERASTKPLYIPDDLLAFAQKDGVERNPAWHQFITKIRRLKTEDGQRLSEAIIHTKFDEADLEYYKSEAKKKKILEDIDRPAAFRITEAMKQCIHEGQNSINELASLFNEFNVIPFKKELDDLLNLVMEIANTSNLWCNAGWTPRDLSAAYPPVSPRTLVIGPGMQQAMNAEDLEEIKRRLKEMGIEVEM